MTVLYLCPSCEQQWGEPNRPGCMSEYCGREYEKVKEKV